MAVVEFFKKFDNIEKAPKAESMKLEVFRISSFKAFPPHVGISVLKLAKAGFYFTGFQDETACYICDLKLQDWDDSLDPFAMHRNFSPNCPYVNNNIDNIPMGESAPCRESFRLAQKASTVEGGGILNGRNGLQRDGTRGLSAPSFTSVPSEPPPLQSDSQQANLSSNQEFLRSQTNSMNNSLTQGGTLANGRGQSQDTIGGFQRAVNNSRGGSNWKKDYRYERSRLNSFQNWPSNAAIRPTDLAAAGFYYMGTDDRVQCVFCRGILRNWEPEDNALSEHRRHFGQCPFLVNPEEVGNVKLGQEGIAESDDSGAVGEEQASHASGGEVLPPAEDYCRGIVKDKPIQPMYALPADRLKTFKNFPMRTQTPEQLTRAGFYFSGISDNVKCFFCDGGLRNWEANDDPWTEHARWFPRCGYIRLCKGDEFIREVQQRFAPPPQDHKSQNARIARKKKNFEIAPSRLTASLTSRTAQTVVEMGWESDMVREVIKRRLEELNDDFPNAESLLEALQEYEHELQYIDQHADSDESLEAKPSNETNGKSENTNTEEGTKKKNKKKKKKKNKGGAGNGDKDNNGGDQDNSQTEMSEPLQYMDDEEAQRLADDIQRMKDERLCKVCMDEEVNIVFLRCGHLVCCSNCAPALRHCPICRELIRGTVRVFLS